MVGEAFSVLVARIWYKTEACKSLLDATDHGRLMFIWTVNLNDGNVIRQFEDHIWELLLSNPTIDVPSGLKLSTDVIPRDKVVQFNLFPIARTLAACPWFKPEGFFQVVDPEKEELLAYWLVDRHVAGGPGVSQIARQVIGVRDRKTGKRNLTIISPTGVVTANAPNDDQSFEGE